MADKLSSAWEEALSFFLGLIKVVSSMLFGKCSEPQTFVLDELVDSLSDHLVVLQQLSLVQVGLARSSLALYWLACHVSVAELSIIVGVVFIFNDRHWVDNLLIA